MNNIKTYLLDVSSLEEKIDQRNSFTKNETEIATYSGKRYQKLANYLSKENDNGVETVKLTFTEIANIIKTGTKEGSETIDSIYLPESARIHRAFWANTDSHSIALSWMSAGYIVREARLPYETEEPYVLFIKNN